MRPVAGDTSPLYQQPCKSWRKEPSSYWVSSMSDVPLKTEAPSIQSTTRGREKGKLPLPDLGLKTHSHHVQKRKKGAGNAPGR